MNKVTLLLTILLFSTMAWQVHGSEFFKQGTTQWRIYLPQNPDPVERFAAQELQQAIKRVSQAKFPIVVSNNPPSKNAIIVGSLSSSPAIREQNSALQLESGSEQKSSVKTIGGNLYLAGRSSKGVTSAVFLFLHRIMKVRYFWPDSEPDGEFYPQQNNFTLPAISIIHDPQVKYRGYHFLWSPSFVPSNVETWLVRNHGNILHYGLGGGVRAVQKRKNKGYYIQASGHNISPRWKPLGLNIADAVKKHPEWFAKRNGKIETSQFCWNNAELEGFIFQWAKRFVQENPQLDMVGFYPEDNMFYCLCKTCAAQSVSNNWFGFLNRLTSRLHEIFPNLKFTALAYEGYLNPPDFELKNYEFIQLSFAGRCFSHQMSDAGCNLNKNQQKLFRMWTEKKQNIGVRGYEYATFVPAIHVPHYKWHNDQMEFFLLNNVCAMTPEIVGGAKKPNSRSMNRLGAYIETRLMYNPQEKAEDIMVDFCSYVFPKSKEYMLNYYRFMEERFHRVSAHFSGYGYNPGRMAKEFLSSRDVEKVFALFAAAEKKITGNGDESKRERSALNWERNCFSDWSKEVWLFAGETVEMNSGQTYTISDIPGTTIELRESKGNLAIGMHSENISNVALKLTDLLGKERRGKIILRNGKGNLQFDTAATPEPLRSNLTITLTARDGKTMELRRTILNYSGAAFQNSPGIMFLLPLEHQYASSVASMRSLLLSSKVKSFFVNSSNLPVLNPATTNAVVVRLSAKSLPRELLEKKLLPFARSGGLLILSVDGNNAAGKCLAAYPQLTFNIEHVEQGQTQRLNLVSGKAQKIFEFEDLAWAREFKYFAPSYSIQPALGSSWEVLANWKNVDSKVFCTLLLQPYGKGSIAVVAASMGIDDIDSGNKFFSVESPNTVKQLVLGMLALDKNIH